MPPAWGYHASPNLLSKLPATGWVAEMTQRRGVVPDYLYNASLSTVTGPLVPGIAGTLQNSQSMLFGMGSSAAMASSTDLAVSIEIDLLGSFAAASKNVYVWIVDNAGSGTGWIQTSTWNPVQSDPPPVSCSLRVDQLPGTPTVTRTSGNNIVGQGFLVVASSSGRWKGTNETASSDPNSVYAK